MLQRPQCDYFCLFLEFDQLRQLRIFRMRISLFQIRRHRRPLPLPSVSGGSLISWSRLDEEAADDNGRDEH